MFMLIKPVPKGVKVFLKRICRQIAHSGQLKVGYFIEKLNRQIRGWGNYYWHVITKKTFIYVDDQIYQALARWMKRKHPSKLAV